MLLHAWSGSVAVAGDVAAPSQMEQPVDLSGGLCNSSVSD
jgi:hypothetical protein